MSPFLQPQVPDPFAQGLEIFAEDLPEVAAQILRQKKKEFGDSIDNPEELKKLMELLEQTGGDMNGLARPEFDGLDGMSTNERLQALIDWILNGGPEQNRSRSLGSMQPHGNYQARPTTWNGGAAPSGYFAGNSSGPASSGGGGGGGGPAAITPAPTEARRTPNRDGWVLPVEGTITSRFGGRESPTTGAPDNHTGLDIAAPGGTPIQAAKDGVVKFSGENGGYGNLVIIDHGDGTETYYGHASALHVQPGQQVKAGDVIASVGTTGNSTGNHLHFEIRQNGTPIDPAPYLGL
jgi:murein DD-endopeptidase MepM/ murein hydrolase activator NlpD